jgi:ketosteroid isomerase-like protein
MSEQNVAFVRAVLAAWGEGDVVPVAAALDPANPPPEIAAAFAPDIEVVWAVNAPGQREYHGHDGLIRAYQEWLVAFSEFFVEELEFIDAGDHVIVPQRHRGRGLGSGVEVVQDLVHVYSVRDGRIARIREYDTLEEARAALAADA